MAERIKDKVPVYVAATNIISPLGLDTVSHWRTISMGESGIRQHSDTAYSEQPFFASKLDAAKMQYLQAHTAGKELLSPFEQMCILSVKNALEEFDGRTDSKTLFVLASTKGNIEWLNTVSDERLLLSTSAQIVAKNIGITTKPIVVSQACVSGISAIIYAMRAIEQGICDTAIVTGCDRFTHFVLSGFQSFQAVAGEPCRPFDKGRTGITLGEAAATIVLTKHKTENNTAQVLAGAVTNDANHISGPSRTGEELALAIERTLVHANIGNHDVDAISAHGTGTLYNDEMEAKAFNLCGLQQKPLHSLKGYMGHTLGAAGIVESIMLIESIKHGMVIPSKGYETNGVSMSLNVSTSMHPHKINYGLKTASGFGGSNGAVLFRNLL